MICLLYPTAARRRPVTRMPNASREMIRRPQTHRLLRRTLLDGARGVVKPPVSICEIFTNRLISAIVTHDY
jgi:hypothetical protein